MTTEKSNINKIEKHFNKFDLHLHSKYSSCAVNEPKTIIKQALGHGLKGIALTDHNTIKGWAELQRLCRENDLVFIPGQEITATFQGKRLGHILALFTYDKIESFEIFDIIDQAKSQAALLSIPHPFDFGRKFSGFELLSKDKSITKYIPAMETFNSRVYNLKTNKKAEEFAKKNYMLQTAGSDAHMPHEIGNGYLIANAQSETELLKEIKLGRVVVGGQLSGLVPKIQTLGAYLGIMRDNYFK
ncbi:MAG: CehA/McbA family metallohydrolase [Candidatus ainarchaeum sp.]|nr:CehA/McbA family metallohydrolase [Candidatus ainarchaeum sp.]